MKSISIKHPNPIVSTPKSNTLSDPSVTPQVSLTGVVERITFHSDESGYTVARLQIPRAHDLVTIVGNFANIQAGQTLQLQGTWKEHLQYGQQFQVIKYSETKPATLTGIEKYLGSGLIKGVGPVTAKRIVAHFNLDTLEIIEQDSHRLIEVPGIGKKRVKMIQRAWNEQKAIKEVMGVICINPRKGGFWKIRFSTTCLKPLPANKRSSQKLHFLRHTHNVSLSMSQNALLRSSKE